MWVPWFPYPTVGVAELEPPDHDTKKTSWNFDNITLTYCITASLVTELIIWLRIETVNRSKKNNKLLSFSTREWSSLSSTSLWIQLSKMVAEDSSIFLPHTDFFCFPSGFSFYLSDWWVLQIFCLRHHDCNCAVSHDWMITVSLPIADVYLLAKIFHVR